MNNNEVTGTLTSGNGTVELVKKCVVCNGTLIVEKWEADRDRHEDSWICELRHMPVVR